MSRASVYRALRDPGGGIRVRRPARKKSAGRRGHLIDMLGARPLVEPTSQLVDRGIAVGPDSHDPATTSVA